MNSNLFHNLANAASLLLAAGTAALITSGCAQSAAGALDCSASFIDPKWTAGAIVALQAIKIGVNLARDGLDGLTKPQPPVQK